MLAQIMNVKEIREKYGDNLERFCYRTCASKPSVNAWENGSSKPHGAMKTLLEYAGEYYLDIEPIIDPDFAAMNDVERLKSVMEYYEDTPIRFAVRISSSATIVERWLAGSTIGNMAKRLLIEMRKYPERFTL